MKTTRSPSTLSGSDPKSQLDKFKEAARDLETDDSEEAFDAKLKRVAKAPKPKAGNEPISQ